MLTIPINKCLFRCTIDPANESVDSVHIGGEWVNPDEYLHPEIVLALDACVREYLRDKGEHL